MRAKRILFIGNSFTDRNDLPGILERLGAAARPRRRIETDRVIAGGQALKAHYNRAAARDAIRAAKWDYVVLQEQSTLPLKNPARMHESVRLFDAEIRRAGAKTVLYMTWARQREFERQASLSEAYSSIGESIGATVVPVGEAWSNVLRERPDLVLHDRDGSHPNFAGTYLAACVFFAVLFSKSPEGLKTEALSATRSLEPDVESVLQRAAWVTVQSRRGPPTARGGRL